MVQTETASPPTTLTLDEVLIEVAQRRQEFSDRGYVPRDFVERLRAAGVYRAATPVQFGGEARPPADFLSTIERISTVDGSTGWVASFGCQATYLGSLPLQTQAELYSAGPDLVFAGALFPIQHAVETPSGFRVNGRWKFASGSMGADVICVGIPGDESTDGKPRGALLRPEQVEIVQEWDVVGMRGTGSFDLVAEDVEVDRAWTFIRGGEVVVDEPLYRYPTITYAAQALSVVSAGVARAALDVAQGVGRGRASITGAPRLADRAYYRAGVAEAEARLRAARAYFFEATDEAWAEVQDGPMSDRANAHLRLAAAFLARTSSEVVHQLVSLSGTAAIFHGHPLLDLHHDALVPQEHAFLSPAMYDAAGAVLMGQAPTVPAFR